MVEFHTARCTAFMGTKAIASGDVRDVALKAKAAIDRYKWAQVLIFDDITSALVEVDFRGSAADVLRRIDAQSSAGAARVSEPRKTEGETRHPGRPKLGVIARASGLAGKSARGCIGHIAQAGGVGKTSKPGQRPQATCARVGVSVLVCYDGERARLRRSAQMPVRRQAGRVRQDCRTVANRCPGAREEVGRRGVRELEG